MANEQGEAHGEPVGTKLPTGMYRLTNLRGLAFGRSHLEKCVTEGDNPVVHKEAGSHLVRS